MAFDDDINFEESDNFLNGRAATGLLGSAFAAHQLGKYAKRGLARSIDTFGFGANVQGSYEGTSKIRQYTNNLLMSGEGSRRNIPKSILKSLLRSGNPVELEAMKSSLELLERHMSMRRSSGLGIPKAMKNYYLDLKAMEPERKMAQAVLQKSMRQPINFEHGGKFIEKALPQVDIDIKRALTNKGFDVNKPFTVFDVSDDKMMIKKMRQASTGDPRMSRISKALKEGDISKAKRIADTGEIKYKGEYIKTLKPIKLVKQGDEYVAKFVPHYTTKGGKLNPVKEYVVGGHTQKVHFKRFSGHKGFHKHLSEMFDITSYASAGEKFDIKGNPFTNLRVGLAGEVGRKLGIHEPIVTMAQYTHRAPGGGRPKGATDVVKRKSRSFVEAAAKTIYDTGKKVKAKDSKTLLNIAKMVAKGVLTKGRSF